MPTEINDMLNGTIPTTNAIRCCWCNSWMAPRYAGEPCVSCLVELRLQENLEEAACDYAASNYSGRNYSGRDYALLQDGGID